MNRNDQPQMKARRSEAPHGATAVNVRQSLAGNLRIPAMSRSLVERRLTEVAERLKQLRDELGVADEQLAHLADEADDARLRALVSETPLAEREHREAQRHADAMRRHRGDRAPPRSRSSSRPRTSCSTGCWPNEPDRPTADRKGEPRCPPVS